MQIRIYKVDVTGGQRRNFLRTCSLKVSDVDGSGSKALPDDAMHTAHHLRHKRAPPWQHPSD